MAAMQIYEPPLRGLFEMFGQRLRMHIVNCEKHANPDVVEYFYGPTSFNLDMIKERPLEIYQHLKHSKYIPYSCLIILINSSCKCRTRILRRILKNIRRNPYLRHKSKLIISPYCLAEEQLHKAAAVLKNNLASNGSYLHPPAGTKSTPHLFKDVTVNTRRFLMDHLIFHGANMENTLFMQIFVPKQKEVVFDVDMLLYNADLTPMMSMNELFLAGDTFYYDYIVETSTNADFYFYTINPALAIIINNYYFTNAVGTRQGSEQDVTRVIRQLKIERIPFILLQDCSRNEILQIMDYVEHKNFTPLKSLLFFLMSHGHSNDVVYTHDGQLDLKQDIVNRIQSNRTLDEAEILVVANACRGKFDAEADEEDEIPIVKTDSQYLRDNIVVMYSVPESLASPRDVINGSPFIKRFCRYFSSLSNKNDIRSVKDNIDKDLVSTDDYYCYLNASPTELVARDDTKDHCILKKPINARQMMQLVESILEDFPTLGDGDDNFYPDPFETKFYICGLLCRLEVENVTFADKYFSNILDKDLCGIDVETKDKGN